MEEKMVSVDCLKLEGKRLRNNNSHNNSHNNSTHRLALAQVKRLRESLTSKADEVSRPRSPRDPHSFRTHTQHARDLT